MKVTVKSADRSTENSFYEEGPTVIKIMIVDDEEEILNSIFRF